MATTDTSQHIGLSYPTNALQISQKAPAALSQPPPSTSSFPLSLFSKPESRDAWAEYEQLFLACLRTGDDKSAHLCLERLTQRFGATDEKIMGLRGLYQEAVAEKESDLESILKEYHKILDENPVNVPILKRRIALLQSMKRVNESITCLVDYLDHYPTDVEGWVQLAELYHSQGLSAQAIFSLEEALLITPNAWNLQTRLGELNFVAANATSDGSEQQRTLLSDALRRFSRSLELCEDYLRALYGLKVTSEKFLKLATSAKSAGDSPSTDTLERLDKLATDRLSKIVSKWSKSSTSGKHSEQEIIAAKELLDRK